MKICIITPTFNRETLLRRHLRSLSKQTFKDWQAIVIHDGPNSEIRAMVENFRAADGRIDFIETQNRSNDTGTTPRLTGLEYALSLNPKPDYCVFWDDDNLYVRDALARISVALERANYPDVLIVQAGYGSQKIPPVGAQIDRLPVGEIDSACFVMRLNLARDAWAHVQQQKRKSLNEVLLVNDYMVYKYILDVLPKARIVGDLSVFVGRHDELRWKPYIRRVLGIPPLQLASRPWFKALTFGIIKSRPARGQQP